jgi:hypothetical protein
MRQRLAFLWLNVVLASLFAAAPARGYILYPGDLDPWLWTSSGLRSGNGDPATITWSIVPDGTSVTTFAGGSTSPSNLISFMNTNFGGNPQEPDLTQQPWFHLFEESFGRWAALGGVKYVYEPEDDGMLHPGNNGRLGVRGDIRIGGHQIDGHGGTLAFNYRPPDGSDMVLDTGDVQYFSNAANNYRRFRNTVMHEIGHGIGLAHLTSSSYLLMEATVNTRFDGPQLDEVRGVQLFFGDANEESNGGQGNDSAALATSLGTIAAGSSTSVGAAANVAGQAISDTVTDFVSISNVDDTDYFSFAVAQPSLLDATLTPRGGEFTQALPGQVPTSFDANSRSDLALTVFETNGTSILATASVNPAGEIESLADVMLPAPGTYFARVTGADDTIQLYELSLSIAAALPGDFNSDGVVNGADYVVWRKSGMSQAEFNTWRANFGAMAGGVTLAGDFNSDGVVNAADYVVWRKNGGTPAEFNAWRANFGAMAGSGSGSAADSLYQQGIVPEPGSMVLLLLATIALRAIRCR